MKKHIFGCGKCPGKRQALPRRLFTFFSSFLSRIPFVLFFSCLACVFLISCRTLSGNKTSEGKSLESDKNSGNPEIEECFFSDEEILWHKLEDGFQAFSYSDFKSGVKYTLVKIDLSNPNLEIVSLLPEFYSNQEISSRTESIKKPDKENQTTEHNRTESGWTKTKSVEKFAEETDSLVAINTTPFMTEHRNPFSKAKPVGLQIIDGKTVYGPNGKYSAIAFFKNRNENRSGNQSGTWNENHKNPGKHENHRNGGFYAEIFDSQNELFTGRTETHNEKNLKPDFAHGGFWTILRNGEIKPFKEIKDVRSAAALKDSGATLILFAGSPFTYTETARLFKKLDADSAIQFDGGTSANLVINGKSCLKLRLKRKTTSAIGFRISRNTPGNPSENQASPYFSNIDE